MNRNDSRPEPGMRQDQPQADVRVPVFARVVVLIAGLASAAAVGVVAVLLVLGHADIWSRVETAADHLAGLAGGELFKDIASHDRRLEALAAAATDPAVERLPADLRHKILFGWAAHVDDLEAVFVTDAAGRITGASSGKPAAGADTPVLPDFAPYGNDSRAGLLVGESRLLNGAPALMLVREITRADGSFAGTAVGEMSLDHLRETFSKFNLGLGGRVLLIKHNGQILLDVPLPGTLAESELDTAAIASGVREIAAARPAGDDPPHADAASRIIPVDGYLVTARVAEDVPLALVIAIPADGILAGWRMRRNVITIAMFLMCGGLLASAFRVRREILRRERLEADLAQLSVTDELTGLPNRRKFNVVLEREWRRARRARSPLTLVILDADHFKKLNDRFGHLLGDEVLVALAQAINSSIRRPGDFAARFGGEEFAIILPDTSASQAAHVVGNIQRSLAEMRAGFPERIRQSDATVSISAGVSCVVPHAGLETEALLSAADEALYRAKLNGRNRFEIGAECVPPDGDGASVGPRPA